MRVTTESDWRGSNVRISTKRSDGIPANFMQLGGLSEVQTITFRADNANASQYQQRSSQTYKLMLGQQLVGNFTYGCPPAEWQTALQTLANVEGATVTRTGDGVSPFWSYGYVYTVTFWGSFGTEALGQLVPMVGNLTLVDVFVNTVRKGEHASDFSARYVALKENQAYSLRVRAINDKGLSTPSTAVSVTTDLYGEVPGSPQSLVLGRYGNDSSLSVDFRPPQRDGGLAVTSYAVSADGCTYFCSYSVA